MISVKGLLLATQVGPSSLVTQVAIDPSNPHKFEIVLSTGVVWQGSVSKSDAGAFAEFFAIEQAALGREFLVTRALTKKGSVTLGTVLVAGAVALAAFFVCSQLGKDGATEGTNSGPTAMVPAAAPQIFEVGTAVRAGDFSVALYQVESKRRLGSQFSPENAGPEAEFLLVYWAIKNEGNRTVSAFSDPFSITDQAGRQFNVSSRGQTALMMEGREGVDFLLSELQPGITKSSVTAFEIPRDVRASDAILEISTPGTFGSGKIKFRVPALAQKKK